MRMRILLLASTVLLVGIGMVGGQSTGQVYHAVGPAMFTNAAVWGYPDGLLAGSNFLCGVYAGTASNDLTPCFGSPDGNLKEHFWLGFGRAWLWGNVVVDAPVEKPLVLQFRAWPAEFGSYEAAVAWSNPSPPVGTSEIVPALEYGWIYEVFWEAGPVWLSPLVAPGGVHGPLACRLAANLILVSWPTNSGSWLLVATSSLTSKAVWSEVGGLVVVTNGYNQVTVLPTNEVRFFRLAR